MTDWHKKFAFFPTQIGNRKVWLSWYAWRELDRWEYEEPRAPINIPAYRPGDTANDLAIATAKTAYLNKAYFEFRVNMNGGYLWREFSLPDGYLIWGKKFCTPYGCCDWDWIGCD